MAYALVNNVTDHEDLLDELYNFATVTDGNWTGVYNEDLGHRQIGIEQDNCHIALGSRTADVGISRTPSGTDTIVSAALSTSLTEPGNRQYWGHPGSIVTSDGDNDRIMINDLGEPPFSNVWFFSEDSGVPYIHCVVQSSGERYTNFTFGIIDALGMTHPNCAYAASGYWEWWPNGTSSNDPGNTSHDIGHLCKTDTESQVYVPSGVLPVGFPSAGVYLTNYCTQVMTRGWRKEDHTWSGDPGHINDFFLAVDPQAVTGGNVLLPIPWFFQDSTSGSLHVCLGVLPQIRIANIGSHTPGDILLQGTEEWVIFPWKRKGIRDNTKSGGNPLPDANSIEFAFAYKKNV